MERLIEFFGKDKLITEITGDDVAKLVAWRRGHRIERGGKIGALVGPFTVNDTTEKLQEAVHPGEDFGRALRSRAGMEGALAEGAARAQTRVGRRRAAAARSGDARRLCAVLRLRPCDRAQAQRMPVALERGQLGERQIVKIGKGGNHVTTPITSAVREILWPLRGHHPEFVFTFVAARTLKGRGLVKGERYPISYQGVKTAWRRLRADAGVTTFRFHDFRHNVGTKLLRETGNLKLVQRALNHADLKTTARYAHVFDEDVAAALERFGEARQRIAGVGRGGRPGLPERGPERCRDRGKVPE